MFKVVGEQRIIRFNARGKLFVKHEDIWVNTGKTVVMVGNFFQPLGNDKPAHLTFNFVTKFRRNLDATVAEDVANPEDASSDPCEDLPVLFR